MTGFRKAEPIILLKLYALASLPAIQLHKELSDPRAFFTKSLPEHFLRRLSAQPSAGKAYDEAKRPRRSGAEERLCGRPKRGADEAYPN